MNHNPELDRDVPCAKCGYNLRGLTRDRLCPECAEPVAGSVIRDEVAHAGGVVPLVEADPRWLRGLAFGCGLIVLAALFDFAMYVLAMSGSSYWRRWIGELPMVVASHVMIAAGV